MPGANNKKLRVLVTGGHGFLGKHVCKTLDNFGTIVIAPARKEANLLHGDACRDYFEGVRADVVVHLAACCGGIGFNRDQGYDLFSLNMRMGANVINACLPQRPKLIFIGTTCSYPEPPNTIPFREDELFLGYPENTNAPYGIAKRALLVACQAAHRQYGLPMVYLILANMYGPGDNFSDSGHAIPNIIRKLKRSQETGQPAALWGDGSPTRDFLYVQDAADAITRAVRMAPSDTMPVNVGTGVETTIDEVVPMIGKHYPKATWVWNTGKPNGQKRRCLYTKRARESFGWYAKVGIEDGIGKTVDWYNEQEAGA